MMKPPTELPRAKSRGFTLVEMLVVLIIIVLVAGGSIALMNNFLRNEAIREGGTLVMESLMQAKALSAEKRTMHFVVFENRAEGSFIKVCQDVGTPPNKEYDEDTDLQVPGRALQLPKFVSFVAERTPMWIGIEPNGYAVFSPDALQGAFTEVQASEFEAKILAKEEAGDIVLKMENKPFRMCMDVDRGSGKIRRFHRLELEKP